MALTVLFLSCSSVSVSSDYDKTVNFSQYKTYAFYKKGIDKLELSDLDKRRILHAVEKEMEAKGFQKSENPDLLVNIFAKSKERIDIYNNNYMGWYPWYYGAGWGMGWGPGWGPGFGMGWGYGPGFNNVVQSTEGTIFIDLIDYNKKELAWQGMGTGILSKYKNVEKKEEMINDFVNKILTQYPPALN